jgi:leader peptidase (prepilin peptidase) / N-methyltransferase
MNYFSIPFNQPYPFPFSPDVIWLLHIGAFICGCCIGSFLNVCIWRIPRGESVVSPPSHCPNCDHVITWYENLPLLSWLCLRGKCSNCKNPISSRYFIVEFMTGLLFYMLWFKVTFDFQPITTIIVYWGVAMLCVTTAFIDVEHRLIPNKTTYPAIILGVAAAIFWPEIWGPGTTHKLSIIYSLAGLLIGGGGMALLAIIGEKIFKVEAMGWGDVKYIAAIGACLGLRACFFILLIGSLLGSVAGIYQAIRNRDNEGFKSTIPFGLYLAIATYIWMLYGSRFMTIYQRIFEGMQL